MSAREVRRLTRDHQRKKGKNFVVSMLSPDHNFRNVKIFTAEYAENAKKIQKADKESVSPKG
jgi:SET domain-containing protein